MPRTRAGRFVAIAAALTTCCGSALAQSTGPDVIVGDLPDISNNGLIAGPNGIIYDGLAVGTTSCNKGNTPLNWFTGGTDNRHPAICQNFYRLRNGRFEQIGEGWLKHGFTALQGTICQAQFGFNCQATAGTTLGVGCSDPYSSGLNNGTGSGMGPRWQVNASTGLFPYPWANGAGAAIRIRPNDLGLSGDRYFIEGQYICGDDAQTNNGLNKNNNASWREVYISSGSCCNGSTCTSTSQAACSFVFTGGGVCSPNPCGQTTGSCCIGTACTSTSAAACAGNWTGGGTCGSNPCSGGGPDVSFTLTGSTTREQPAIYAWQNVDPTVTIATFDVANDGRFILGCKVTGPVGGLYTYEYALHNLNSHRCAGSFYVPLPGTQGALTGVGFHDAEAVGEPNALVNAADPTSDDWSVSGTGAGSTSVSWGGPPYSGAPAVYGAGANQYQVGLFTAGTGNDHSANVIRWGSLFNFRFTCNVAPGNGSLAVGLWRPGTGTSFVMNARTPGGAVVGNLTASCCTGSTCSVATQTACGTGTWGLPGTTCNPDPCVQGSCCIASTGGCSVSTLGGCVGGTWNSGGSCSPNVCPQPATGSCCVPNVGTCSVTTLVNCSTPNIWASGGSCTPNICAVASGGCCVNSVCSVTTVSGCSGTYLGNSTTCAGAVCPSGNDACAAAIPVCDGTPVVGTTVGATNDGTATCASSTTSPDVWYSYIPAATASVTVDTCTANYDSAISIHTGNCPGTTQVGCDDDACGSLHSRVVVSMTAGVRYLIRVTGYNNNVGNFTLTVTGGGGTGCNGTGRCCTGTACTATTSAACSGTFTAGGSCTGNPCNPTGSCCVGTGCTSTTQSACTGTFTVAGVCSPNPCDPAGRCCTNGSCTSGTQSGCTNGVFTLGGSCSPNPCPPLSDNCANRAGVPVGSTPFDTTNATTDGPAHALCAGSGDSQVGKDVWFNFPCTFDGTIDVDTCGSSFDTKLAIYDGSGCTDFETRILACNDDAICGGTNTLQSRIAALPVACGHHYTIRVGGYTNGSGVTAAGAGTLTITAHPNALGVCCAADGSCGQSQQSCCVGAWSSTGSCTPNPCPAPTGACCNPNSGACTTSTHTGCAAGGNLYQGDNAVCNPNPCPPSTGACCIGTACSIVSGGVCNGAFQGPGTVCGTTANPTTCCKANFNGVNGVTVQDIFDYLAAFFAGDPRADFNGTGGVTIQDIFDYLSAFFVGC